MEAIITRRSAGRMWILLFLLAFFTVLSVGKLCEKGKQNSMKQQTVETLSYRAEFYSQRMKTERDYLSPECRAFLQNVEKEATYYPIPESTVDKSLLVSCVNTWMAERNYSGKRKHEGADIMASRNQRGRYPVLSMTDGTVTKLGWLPKGGNRVGITTDSGTYYYYAHLDSYGNLKEGKRVHAGELLGTMGDSGYGPEGTKGKFAVHLHLGIYTEKDGKEVSVNPYYVLKYLENKKLKYAYS